MPRAKVKPCPFCGNAKQGGPQGIQFIHSEDMDWSRLCRKCWAFGPACASKREATIAWNARTAREGE